MENNFYSGTRVIFPKTKGLKYVLQTKDKRLVSKAELLKDPKYTNKKSIEKEFTGVVREAKLFASFFYKIGGYPLPFLILG